MSLKECVLEFVTASVSCGSSWSFPALFCRAVRFWVLVQQIRQHSCRQAGLVRVPPPLRAARMWVLQGTLPSGSERAGSWYTSAAARATTGTAGLRVPALRVNAQSRPSESLGRDLEIPRLIIIKLETCKSPSAPELTKYLSKKPRGQVDLTSMVPAPINIASNAHAGGGGTLEGAQVSC